MTSRTPTSGKGVKYNNNVDKLDNYQKDSKTKAFGNMMRTFSRTKTSQIVTTWDDVHYVNIAVLSPNFIGDTTGNVDSATAGATPIIALLDKAWEIFYTNANLKDLVAGEETSWKLYFCTYLQIMTELQMQYNLRCLLPAYTESDTVPGAIGALSYFDQSSFDIFCASMSEYPMPKGIDDILKVFFTWVVELGVAYEQYSLRIPPQLFVPYMSMYDLADFEAMRELLRVNLGNAITHAKKFGLKMGKYHDPIKPEILPLKNGDPRVLAYFNHSKFSIYDNTPAEDIIVPDGGFAGVNSTTNWTSVEYFFKDSPNETPFHVLGPWSGIYEATHNPYGGIFHTDVAAVEYRTNLQSVAEHGTAPSGSVLTDINVVSIYKLFKGFNDGAAAVFKLYLDGTNFTAAQAIDGASATWPLAQIFGLHLGTNRGKTEAENDLINYIGRLLV